MKKNQDVKVTPIQNKRAKSDVIKDYNLLSAQYGNLCFTFDVQKQEMLNKFAKLTKEMEMVTIVEESLDKICK